ncbi:cytochrome P450 89A2-like [Impatiens glandulifera]|uniref:cytochrome P450 89A2-like n=1 Tax=Impatiens glandulifera TaxID=253017 RepID=UPI001FB161E3|nr:cytochrome P450 89A2-like [Impatiens glandulifera]
MEIWFFILVTLCVASLLKSISNFFTSSSSDVSNKKKKPLPPGPTTVPIIGRFMWLGMSFAKTEPYLKSLKLKYGPIITLQITSRPSIFIASHSLAHKALVEKGAIFSDRPGVEPTSRITSSNRRSINSAAYGQTWRFLRRNMASEMFHPSRIKSFSTARKWVLEILLDRFRERSSRGAAVPVLEDFQYAMFCLLVLMCFGDKLGEDQIKKIEKVERAMIMDFTRFGILNLWPRIGKIVFRKRWEELIRLRQNQEDVLIPLIRARREKLREGNTDAAATVAYVDTLFDLEWPEEKRKLTDSEIVTLCNEFLNAGTDTTSTALQWIMANLVKYPVIQSKLYQEISSNSEKEREIREEDLRGMNYLKAVVLEGLRLHPPGHFILPHKVTEDVELEGYLVPKEGTVNVLVAELGRDPAVWVEALEFKPERFIEESGELIDVDITGSREIKMMPFGAGRRICPGMNLALIHLEYFVANLIKNFEWKAADEKDIDMSEKQEFTTVMNTPLQAKLTPRSC